MVALDRQERPVQAAPSGVSGKAARTARTANTRVGRWEGLTPAERRGARPWVPFALLFFATGVGLAYVILPYAAGYLLSFNVPGVLESLITADKYFDFVSTLFLAFGIVMEFPIVLILLSKVGIVTSARLRRSRRYAALAIAVFALLATPGGDIVSPAALMGILYGLYEASILAVRFGGK